MTSKIKEYARLVGLTPHPSRLRNTKEYIYSLLLPFESSLTSNDLWGMVFVLAIALFIPPLAWLIPIYVICKTNRRVVAREKEDFPKELEQAVLFIQMNHLQSLTEAIESNPGLLHAVYKKHSLLHWCKYYNNTKALMVVIQLLKKYPKESSSIAA